MIITSLENEKVKNLVKLQQKKYRDLTNTFLVEGEHLVEEAYKNNCIIEIIALEEVNYSNVNTILVSYEVMKKISMMETPPKIMALCRKMESNEIVGEKIVLLDGIQDPGNLGTIIRSSLAFNVSCIVLSKSCVDLYNPKVLRATQGMVFHTPIVIRDTLNVIEEMHEKDINVYGTSVVNGFIPKTLSEEEKSNFCLVMGNEGNGLSEDILKICDKNLYIPMNSKVESLNVGVACSILLYELGR